MISPENIKQKQINFGEITEVNYKGKIIKAICIAAKSDGSTLLGLGLGMLTKEAGLPKSTILDYIENDTIIFKSGLEFKLKRVIGKSHQEYSVMNIDDVESILLAFLDE